MKSRMLWGTVSVFALGLIAWKQGTPRISENKQESVSSALDGVTKSRIWVATAPRTAPKTREIPVVVPDSMKMAFQPLPGSFPATNNPPNDAKIALGRMLYYDKRLSKNHDISCNSCHQLDKFGVDNEATSPGHKKQRGDRNSPTVYNAAGHIAQFWDGRAATVEEQAKGPILNPVEMAMPNEASVVAVLKSIPGYVTAFQKAFPQEKEPVTYDNMAKAIGAFERNLVTPSRWDRFLKGDNHALTNPEKKGFMLFVTTGCLTCHSGPLFGGHMYQKLGLLKPWPGVKDTGRHQVTKQEYDKYMFKVPSLRNVEKTAPYLHNGSVKTLEQMVSMMAEYQLGRTLSTQDVTLIVAFLKSLTGTVDKNYIREPQLPPSSATTPKPNPN